MTNRIIAIFLIAGLLSFFYYIDSNKLLQDEEEIGRTARAPIRLLEVDGFIEQCQQAFTSLPFHHQELITKLINDEKEKLGYSRSFPKEIVFPTADYQDSRSVKTMDAVYLTSPSRITVSTEISRKAQLAFSFSFPRLKPGAGSELMITCRDRYTGQLLLQNTIQLSGKFLHTWYDIQQALHNMSRREIDLEFMVAHKTGEPIELFLGNPIIFSDYNSSDRHPNIILISLDAFRPDHMGCYGYERQTTPVMDWLSKQSSLFVEAFSQSGWTLPSHKSLLS